MKKLALIAMVLVLLVALVPASPTQANGASWYNANWQYRKKITIDHDQVQANHQNFPVLIPGNV